MSTLEVLKVIHFDCVWTVSEVSHTLILVTKTFYYFCYLIWHFQENPLEVTNCPDTIVANLPATSSSVKVQWNTPRVSHKLGRTVLVEVPNNFESGDHFSTGNFTVEYLYKDQDEPKFMAHCTFNVNVKGQLLNSKCHLHQQLLFLALSLYLSLSLCTCFVAPSLTSPTETESIILPFYNASTFWIR